MKDRDIDGKCALSLLPKKLCLTKLIIIFFKLHLFWLRIDYLDIRFYIQGLTFVRAMAGSPLETAACSSQNADICVSVSRIFINRFAQSSLDCIPCVHQST